MCLIPVTVDHFASGPLSREGVWTAFARWAGMWKLDGFSKRLVEEQPQAIFLAK